jgi:hypothetical protein
VLKLRKPHMRRGLNSAAARAFGAVMLIQRCGFTFEQAILCTGSCAGYINAMRWIVESGDQDLLRRVLHGELDIFYAAKQVRPLIEFEAAYAKLTSEQVVQWAAKKGADFLFDKVVVPAAAMAGMHTKGPTFVERTA